MAGFPLGFLLGVLGCFGFHLGGGGGECEISASTAFWATLHCLLLRLQCNKIVIISSYLLCFLRNL